MSEVKSVETAVEFVLPENLKSIVAVMQREISIDADANLRAADDDKLTTEILSDSKYTIDDLREIQDLTGRVNAALLYVGSEKSHDHVSGNKDTLRTAGKIRFGNNEVAFSYQPQLKEVNADGSPKSPVVSVISRQYECESYRDIRKHVMERAKSLRD
jgi:hypothetical protein